MDIEHEATRIARIKQLHNEPRPRFLVRLAKRLLAEPAEGADRFSPELYQWVQAAKQAIEAKDSLPEFDDEVEGSLLEQLLEMLVEEDKNETKRLSSRPAKLRTKSSNELRQKAHELGIMRMLTDPSMSRFQLAESLSADGYPTSERTAKTIISYVTRVVKAMRHLGWRVEDASGERILL